MTPATTPTRLDLKKTEKLEIEFQDGRRCVYPLTLLRSMCPCAKCREQRETKSTKSLNVLPGNYTSNPTVVDAQLVGNYALKIEWSDGHDSGIYSFDYLRSICPSPI